MNIKMTIILNNKNIDEYYKKLISLKNKKIKNNINLKLINENLLNILRDSIFFKKDIINNNYEIQNYYDDLIIKRKPKDKFFNEDNNYNTKYIKDMTIFERSEEEIETITFDELSSLQIDATQLFYKYEENNKINKINDKIENKKDEENKNTINFNIPIKNDQKVITNNNNNDLNIYNIHSVNSNLEENDQKEILIMFDRNMYNYSCLELFNYLATKYKFLNTEKKEIEKNFKNINMNADFFVHILSSVHYKRTIYGYETHMEMNEENVECYLERFYSIKKK